MEPSTSEACSGPSCSSTGRALCASSNTPSTVNMSAPVLVRWRESIMPSAFMRVRRGIPRESCRKRTLHANGIVAAR
jgi:hypothetical protein